MSAALLQFMKRMIAVLSNPFAAPIALLVITSSVCLSIATSGVPLFICDGAGPRWFHGCRWDPGATYMNTFQNELQVVVLFATLTLASSLGTAAVAHARATRKHMRETQDLAANMHALVKKTHAHITKESP